MLRTLFIFLAALCISTSVPAEIYKFKDANGHWCFTDAPTRSAEVVNMREPSIVEEPVNTGSSQYSQAVFRAEEAWLKDKIVRAEHVPTIWEDQKRANIERWEARLDLFKKDPDAYFIWKKQWERDRDIDSRNKPIVIKQQPSYQIEPTRVKIVN